MGGGRDALDEAQDQATQYRLANDQAHQDMLAEVRRGYADGTLETELPDGKFVTMREAQRLGFIKPGDPDYHAAWATGYRSIPAARTPAARTAAPSSASTSSRTTEPRSTGGPKVTLPAAHTAAPAIEELSGDVSDVDMHGVPLFQRQMVKGMYEVGKHNANQPYSKYDLKKRFAPNSAKAKEAEDLAELASPSNAANKATDKSLADRFQTLADASSYGKAKTFEDRLNKNPLDEAKTYENKHEKDVIKALKDDHAEALAEQLAQVSSNPLFNRPGLNFSGAKQRALQKTRANSSKALINVLAKLRHEGFNKAIENQQKQQGIDVGAARNLGALSNEDLNRKLTSAEKLAEKEEKRLASHYKHAGVKHGFASKAEEKEQDEKDAEYEQYLEARDWPTKKLNDLSHLIHGLPSAGSVSHHIKEATPGVYSGPNAMIGQTLAGLATHFLPEKKADGGSIGQQAMTDSLLDNTDPLATNRRLIRHQLMSGLLDYKLKKTKQFRKGGAVSPIQSGADSARRYALQERQLAEAERLRAPQGEEHFITKLAASLVPALTNGGKGTAYEGMGSAIESGLDDRSRRHKAIETNRAKSFDIEKDVAKEMNDDMKFKHQMAVEERRAATDERRAHNEENRYQLELKKATGLGDVELGGRLVKPKVKLGLSTQDQVELRDINKYLDELKDFEKPYKRLDDFLGKSIAEKNEPVTGVLGQFTPDFTEKARELTRNIAGVVGSEAPSGPLTTPKLEFAKQKKPSHLDSPQKLKEFTEMGRKEIAGVSEPLEYTRHYAAVHQIPPRVTLSAYNVWVAEGKKRDFENVLADAIDGNLKMPSHQEKQAQSAPAHSESRIHSLSNLSDEAIAEGFQKGEITRDDLLELKKLHSGS